MKRRIPAQKKIRRPSRAAARTDLDPEFLFLDLVDPTGLRLRGLDLEAVLLGGGGEKSAHAVSLPIGGLLDLGKRGALGPADQFLDLRSLALSTRCAGLAGSLRLLAGLGGRVRWFRFFALCGFLALGRVLLWAGTLPRGGLLRRNGGALFRNTCGVFGGSGFCIHGGESFLRLVGA